MKSIHKRAIAAGAAFGVAAGAWRIIRLARHRRAPKGVFIEYALYDAPAQALRDLGITWVLVQTGVMKPGLEEWVSRDREALEALAQRINPPGSAYKIEIWGWGWPIPSRVEEFAEHTRSVLESPVLMGYCLNIEAKRWSTRKFGEESMHQRAGTLIEAIRKGPRKPLMLSSHGRADLAPLPWDVLSQLDAAMPQCYDSTGSKEAGFIQRCIDSYRELGFFTVIPTLGASVSTAEQMISQLAELPPSLQAVSWWTWTKIGRSPARAAVIRGYSGGVAPSPRWR